jgi:predicted nucleic acid-binding protein
MKSRLIDVNILVKPYLNQDKADICEEFLNKVDYGEIDAVVTVFHLDAAAVILEQKGLSSKKVAQFYYRVYDAEGLKVRYMGLESRLEGLAEEKHSELDDSLLEQALNDLEADEIVTYDTDLDEELRVMPEEILQS